MGDIYGSENHFPGYANVKVCWKLKNFSAEYFNNPNFNLFQSPIFQVTLSNYTTVKFKLIAMRNRNTMNIFMRKDIEDRFYENYGNLLIHYDMKLKDFYINEYVDRASGRIEKLYYEQKLGKCLTSRELSRHHIMRDKVIEVVVFLRLIEKKNILPTASNSVMSHQFEKMFNNQSYSDFTLVTSEDEEIFVHKNILSIRSPVFEAMVNTMLQEGTDKRAKIDDIESRSLTELVRFIYSGRVNEIDPIASELLYAAGKYDLQDLKPLCVLSLAVNISHENALSTFILADLHEEQSLKIFAMDFIKFSYEKIKESEHWKSVSQQQMKLIMDHLMGANSDGSSINLVTTITIQPRVHPTLVTSVAHNAVPAAAAASR